MLRLLLLRAARPNRRHGGLPQRTIRDEEKPLLLSGSRDSSSRKRMVQIEPLVVVDVIAISLMRVVCSLLVWMQFKL